MCICLGAPNPDPDMTPRRPWWRVDLGQVTLVGRVQVEGSFGTTSGGPQALFQVRVGNEETVALNPLCANNNRGVTGTSFVDDGDSKSAVGKVATCGFAGRYVYVDSLQNMQMTLCEVRVFGTRGFLTTKLNYDREECQQACLDTPNCGKVLVSTVRQVMGSRCDLFSKAAECAQIPRSFLRDASPGTQKRMFISGVGARGVPCGRYHPDSMPTGGSLCGTVVTDGAPDNCWVEPRRQAEKAIGRKACTHMHTCLCVIPRS